MNRLRCYMSAMTVASVTSVGTDTSMCSLRNTMGSFQTTSSHRHHRRNDRDPLPFVSDFGGAVRTVTSPAVGGIIGSGGHRRPGSDSVLVARRLSSESGGECEDEGGEEDGLEDGEERKDFATSYHAPVMLTECIDALLCRSHNKATKKEKYKSKAKARARALLEYNMREVHDFSPSSPSSSSSSSSLPDDGQDVHNTADPIAAASDDVTQRPRVFIDGTLGGGGHSHYLLTQLSHGDIVIGCDVDPSALATASERLSRYMPQDDTDATQHDGPIFIPVQSNFKDMAEVLQHITHPLTNQLLFTNHNDRDDNDQHDGKSTNTPFSGVDGVLLDLGVSSHQIDTTERGFAFMKNGPLDMRMSNGSWKNHDTTNTTPTPTTTNRIPSTPHYPDSPNTTGGMTAADICNEFTEQELSRTFQLHANESRQRARKIARSIIDNRPLRTTSDLVDAISAVVPAFSKKSRRLGKMATCARIFASLRIVVNEEDRVLVDALEEMAPAVVRKGGRLVVLSYHSLEDRAVKRVMRDGAVDNNGKSYGGIVERDLYGNHIHDGQVRPWKTLGKRMRATDEEVERNVRARSATLRVAERQ